MHGGAVGSGGPSGERSGRYASPKLFADETPAPVLDPGRGRNRTGHLWAYARDDRPWSGSAPPAVAYAYVPDRRKLRGRHNTIDPQAYLSDILACLVAGHPINRLDELLPCTWTAA
jgi:hypothetical protein